ncbi:MAG: hypothetical protein R3313_02950 [Candidatus Saccharimonadales bacterium]|nr:hypothetical protein [Candidatus Saccharimonadales bacterium]
MPAEIPNPPQNAPVAELDPAFDLPGESGFQEFGPLLANTKTERMENGRLGTAIEIFDPNNDHEQRSIPLQADEQLVRSPRGSEGQRGQFIVKLGEEGIPESVMPLSDYVDRYDILHPHGRSEVDESGNPARFDVFEEHDIFEKSGTIAEGGFEPELQRGRGGQQAEKGERSESSEPSPTEMVLGTLTSEQTLSLSTAGEAEAAEVDPRRIGKHGKPELIVLSNNHLASRYDQLGNEVDLSLLSRHIIDRMIIETDDGEMLLLESFYPDNSVDKQYYRLTSSMKNKTRDPSQPKIIDSVEYSEMDDGIDGVTLVVGDQMVLRPDKNGKTKKTHGKISGITYWGSNRTPQPPGSEARDGRKESDLLERFAVASGGEAQPDKLNETNSSKVEELKQEAQEIAGRFLRKLDSDENVLIGRDEQLGEQDVQLLENLRTAATSVLQESRLAKNGEYEKFHKRIAELNMIMPLIDWDRSDTFVVDENVDGFQIEERPDSSHFVRLSQEMMDVLMLGQKTESLRFYEAQTKQKLYPAI